MWARIPRGVHVCSELILLQLIYSIANFITYSTPWLTTRRRTCPICKGDVVRSLARGQNRYPPYRDDPGQDVQTQAALATNDSLSSAMPIPQPDSTVGEDDLERGHNNVSSPDVSSSLRNRWSRLGIMSLESLRGFSAVLSGESNHQPVQEDRQP